MENMGCMPRVGVVTPFYNTQEYLRECIESVLRQTYKNWEFILVDNYSTDGSGDIAREYASRFPDKIRVVKPEKFLDQIPNYSFGLSQASINTKYCKMVQADDWIYPECLEKLVAVAESDPAIVITSSYRLKGKQVIGEGVPYSKNVVPGSEICRIQLRTGVFAFGTPTTMLYRSDIINRTNPFYDEDSFFDDTDSCYRELRDAKFGFVHQVLSFSRVDDDSIRGRVQDLNPNILDRLLQLSKFGPMYLEPKEAQSLLRDWNARYYSFFARCLLTGKTRGFWKYHVTGLQSGGLKLNKLRLTKHLLLEFTKMVVNPGQTATLMYRKLRSN